MSRPEHTGRTQRVLRHLCENPKGVTLRGTIIAVEPGCKSSNMSGCLYALVYAGKAVTKHADGLTRFYATADALVDKRTTAAKPPRVRKGVRTPKPAKPKPVAKPLRSRIDAEAKAADLRARRMPTGRLLQPSALRSPARPASAEPETVEEFLRRGGNVERLPHGATGQPFAHIGHEAINQATWRARVRGLDDELAA